MGYIVLAGAEASTNYEAGSCPGPQHGTRIGRKHKQKWRREYRHKCVDIEVDTNGNIVRSDHVKTSESIQHHPCKGLGKSTFLGVESNSGGGQPGYAGKSEHFDNKTFAFKCDVPDSKMTSVNLKAWSGDGHMNNGSSGGYVKDNSGTVRSLWDQLVMGIDVSGKGSSEGFCKKVANLPVVVHNNGSTCYSKLNAELQAANRKLYCDQNETDELCACRNISLYGTKRCVEEKSTLPGCAEVKAEYDKFPGKAVTETPPITWTPTCFSSGICARPGQYLPESQPQTCAQTITICTQDLELYGDITGGQIDIDQKMDCDASSTNTPSSGSGAAEDEVEAARAALARGDPGAQERLDAARDALDEGESPISLTDFRTNPRSYIPNSLDGLKTNRKQQLGAGGVGGVFMMMCCCLVVLLLLSSGGGGPVARRFKR